MAPFPHLKGLNPMPNLDPDGRLLAKWVKTREGAGEGLVDALRETFAEYRGASGLIPAPTDIDDDLLTIYPLPDLHLGMYAWADEGGADYDVKIAVAQAMKSIDYLVQQSRPSRRAVVLGLGDYFHANDAKNVTPGSGHLLDVDGRWPKVFGAGARLATAIVNAVAQKHQDVEVVFLPGNHDPDAATSLTVALDLFYDGNPRIQVCKKPGVFWYRRHGLCLLGATHGHTMKPDRMAMAMAEDCAEDWGETKYRHMFFGHIHHESMKAVASVRCESFTTPAPRDGWNHASGYRSTRSQSALTFHAEFGERGRHMINFPPATRGRTA